MRAALDGAEGIPHRGGSLKVYPATQLHEEMAFIAYHFHWSRDELMCARARRAAALVPADLARSTATLDGAPANPFEDL